MPELCGRGAISLSNDIKPALIVLLHRGYREVELCSAMFCTAITAFSARPSEVGWYDGLREDIVAVDIFLNREDCHVLHSPTR